MLFVTDTCFWTHCSNLYEKTSIDLRNPLNLYLWGITVAVQQELINFNLEEFAGFHHANLIPLTDTEFSRFINKYPHLEDFGDADISIIYSAKRDGNIIITDDGGLFLEALSMHIEVMYLPDWCLYLVRDGTLSKNECYQILHFWDQQRKYSQKKIKKWKAYLAKI